MKVTILTYGSRGDVQPFIPLSLGLIARGHSVKLVAPARFRSVVEESNVPFVPLAGDPEELSRYLNDSGSNFLRIMRGLMEHAVEIGVDVLRQIEAACSDADLIIHTFMHAIGAHTLAREMNIPDVHVQLFPMFTPTGDYPNISIPDLRIRSVNRWTHIFSHQIAFWASKAGYEQVRRRAGIPRRKLYSPFDGDSSRPPTPVLCAWSPVIIPPSRDWNANVYVTGYLFEETNGMNQPSGELQQFLDSAESPVCVSFGSMLNRDSERINHIVQESLRETGNRGIFLSGWSNVRESSQDFLYLQAVPHQWLLPYCRMIIHHGGAGTTSAGLLAGIPNIVIPHTADQPFWGNRIHGIGVGPKPISITKLSINRVTDAILECDHENIRQRAKGIGQQLRREHGVINSVELIEQFANDFLRKQIQ
jgi:sterol 3beta-glucosyltransferase